MPAHERMSRTKAVSAEIRARMRRNVYRSVFHGRRRAAQHLALRSVARLSYLLFTACRRAEGRMREHSARHGDMHLLRPFPHL